MNKPRYGIDAPPVIKQLSLIGLTMAIIGLIFFTLLHTHHPLLANTLLITSLFLATVHALFAILMLWSSLYGKLRMRDRLLNALQLQGNETILDIGCGRGLLLIGAAQRLQDNGKAVGIDLWSQDDLSNNTPGATRLNAELAGVSDRITITSGDMCQMEYTDNTFDIIVSSMAIHNIPTSHGRQTAIQEIARVLKPGGKIALLDFQRTDEYQQTLLTLNWTAVTIAKRSFLMFPPVRLVTADKPQPQPSH